ncbi:hypothetical protein RHOSPDRAFT_34091 [Rhodotorula sp. JG-1b]|nr:hypothetical protein RHOSPDRAFT_34091 [Rhodotorula sp. JG-1b]
MRLAASIAVWASLATLLCAAPTQSVHRRIEKKPKAVLAASSNPDDPSVGSQVAVNWINPIRGNVTVMLESNIGGPTYVIAPSVPAISQEGYCDSGAGVGVVQPGHECGMVQFVVPEGWERMNNYTIVVMSLDNSNTIGYTDMITIANANSSSPSNVPSSEVPTGTAATLLTIPAPTSTNVGASTPFDGTLPSPTAVSRAVSSSPPSSSVATSSGGRSSASVSGSQTGSAVATSAQSSAVAAGAATSAASATSASTRINASWATTFGALLLGMAALAGTV